MQHIGGLDELKKWLSNRAYAFSEKARAYGLPEPKGVLLLGVQGCGKSLAAKATAAEWKLPLLRLDVGSIFNQFIGSSEENIRKAISTAESLAPAILWIDEIEKGFSGGVGTGHLDAGVTARVFATFLTWLQEKKAPVFVFATANEIWLLPPEFFRKGRFDEVFFVDLPQQPERLDIFRIHLEKRGRKPENFDVAELAKDSEGMSGAEIEQCVVAAMYEVFPSGRDITTADVSKAMKDTVPLSVTMKESIDDLRRWARHRTRMASGLPPTLPPDTP
jgi:SpoVK/Ycf46/Vps4 family AAA+-type ATPase